MSQKTVKTIGWVLTALVGFLIGFSAFLKLSQNEMALEQAVAMGFEAETYRLIGVVEVVSLVLFIVPRTGVLGALLLIAYMGGAIASHLQHQQPVATALAVQVMIWVASALRFPELRQRLFGDFQK